MKRVQIVMTKVGQSQHHTQDESSTLSPYSKNSIVNTAISYSIWGGEN